MTQGFSIDAGAVYDDAALQIALGMGAESLASARKSGGLRFTRKGRRIFYLGRWILDWMEVDAHRQREPEVAHT